MDPISAAVLAALAAPGLTDAAKQAVADAYGGFKGLLQHKFGAESELAKAVAGVEVKPDSDARKSVLQEEVKAAKADQDADVKRAAQTLLDKVQAQPGGRQVMQQAIGNYIAIANDHSSASVNVNIPKT